MSYLIIDGGLVTYESFVLSSKVFGSLHNVKLSSTELSIPLIDNGGINHELSDAGTFRITIESALPSFAGDIHATVKNLTQNTSQGPLPIYNGTTTNEFSGTLSVSSGDQLSLVLSITGSYPVVIPQLHWYISEE